MKKTLVLVVDDSLTVRKRIAAILSSDPDLEVVGEAADGEQAIHLCQLLRPDVITLDMILPGMSGVAVTEYVMANCPTPILVVSASMNRGEVCKTFEALSAGAVDVLDKPTRESFHQGWDARLVSAVKLVSRIPVIMHPRARLRARQPDSPPPVFLRPVTAPAAAYERAAPALVAIGASTGGPSALVEILGRLPMTFPIPIAIVIHIGGDFVVPFVEWLGKRSTIPVRLAEDGEPLPSEGEPLALIAPGERHLVLRDGCFRLTSDAERHSCRPSVDVFFETVAAELGSRSVGCLLTGMGRDGAEGLLAMRRRGATTLAQDEATSMVFGMPHAAVNLGAVMRVVSIQAVAGTLVELASVR